MWTRRSGVAALPQQNRRPDRLGGWGGRIPVFLMALATGCASVQMEVYKRPNHDFAVYDAVAVLPLSSPGKQAEDREGVEVVTAVLGAALVKHKYPILDAETATARLTASGIQADGGSDEITLRKAAQTLGVRGILTGDLEYYGPFDFNVPPREVPYGYYDWWGYPRRAYYIEPGYTETGSRAALKLKLFDGELGAYVWWAEGDRSGSERIAQRYAKQIIEKAIEKFPVKPPGKKRPK